MWGCSNDLAWDGESKRIIAVGDGKEKCVLRPVCCVRVGADACIICRFGHAFMMDSGSSTGEIIGHSKVCWCAARAARQ